MIFAPFSRFFTLISFYGESRRAVILRGGGKKEGKSKKGFMSIKKPLISRGKMFRN
jgi:hypothetical protein